jgi:hypothetical protein
MEPRLVGWLELAGGMVIIAALLVAAWLVLQALAEAYAPVFRILGRF